MQRLDDRGERLGQGMSRLLQGRRATLAELAARLPHPRQQLTLTSERLDGLAGRLNRIGPRLHERAADPWHHLDAARRMGRSLAALLAERRRELAACGGLLESLSHRRVLERGFVTVEVAGQLATRAAQVAPGSDLLLGFADGKVMARAAGAAPPKGGRPAGGDRPSKPRQGSLL